MSSPSSSTSSRSSAEKEGKSDKKNTVCLKCGKKPIEYETNSCHHHLFCRECAMKCASGGKCKVCGELYGNLQKLRD